MTDDRANQSSTEDRDFVRQVSAKAARKLRVQKNGQQTVWFGLGMTGLIGWSVAVPTIGGAMLGLGRAIGETIAVTILIGDAPKLGHQLFGQGYTLAAVIANEFGEAQGLHRSALFAAALLLFVLTLVVNGFVRDVLQQLPMEFAVEAQKLIAISLEGSVG